MDNSFLKTNKGYKLYLTIHNLLSKSPNIKLNSTLDENDNWMIIIDCKVYIIEITIKSINIKLLEFYPDDTIIREIIELVKQYQNYE